MTKEEIQMHIEIRKRRLERLQFYNDKAAEYERDMLNYDLKELERMLNEKEKIKTL